MLRVMAMRLVGTEALSALSADQLAAMRSLTAALERLTLLLDQPRIN